MSGFISPALLAQLQGISEGEMPDSFTVDVPGTFTPDGQGGGRYGLPTTRGPYSCRFSRADAVKETTASRDEQSDASRVGANLLSYPLDVELSFGESCTGTLTRSGEVFRFEVEASIPVSTFSVNRKARIRRTGDAP